MTASLKDKSTYVLNFTNRIDIDRGSVSFEVTPSDKDVAYRIRLLTWASIRPRITKEMNLTVALTRGGTADSYVDMGAAIEAISSDGEILGNLESWYEPTSLGARIMISDPTRSHAIVVAAKMGRPDVVKEEDSESEAVPIRSFARSSGKESGLIDIFESEDVAGHWNLNLTDVEVPQLVVSKQLGKARVVSDPVVQNIMLPEVFRRIVTALASDPERFVDEPWVSDWKKLAAHFSPTSDWDFYVSDIDDVRQIEDRVGDGVSGYIAILPTMPAAIKVRDQQEDAQ